MDSTPKRWILKPLSPILKPSDLQIMTVPAFTLSYSTSSSSNPYVVVSSSQKESSQDILVQTSPIAIVQNRTTDDSDQLHLSSSSSSKSPSSPSSPQHGFYSFVEDPMSPEAKQNESWMVSSLRQAYLATLKEETGFKLQAYNSNKKPQTLFSENKEDLQYKIDTCNSIKVICETEEKQLRKTIIRSQAPRKILAQMSCMEVNLTQPTSTMTESYSPVSSRTKLYQPTQTQTSAKSDHQTNFKTIRKHFLNMEQEHLKALLSPDRSTKLLQVLTLQSKANVSLPQGEEKQRPEKVKKNSTPIQDELKQQERPEINVTAHTTDGLQWDGELTCKLEDRSCASNSGLLKQDNTTPQILSIYESPTENKIRALKEHEENLQRSCKLENNRSQRKVAKTEMKCSLSLLTPRTNPETIHKKEIPMRNLEMKNLHHEIPEQVSQDPLRTNVDRTDNIHTEEKPQMDSRTGDIFPFPCCPHRHQEELKFCQANAAASSQCESDVQNAMCFQENPAASLLPSLYFSSSLKSAPHCESENLGHTSSKSRGPAPLDLIKKEIQEVLIREQELKEMRQSRVVMSQPLLSPASLVEKANMVAVRQFYPQLNKEKLVRFSTSSNAPQPWPTSSRVQQEPPIGQSRTEIPVQEFEIYQAKLKLEESSYGGILLVDNINNKVIESTRVVRHKNQRALRWEAGVFTNKKT